ncbi:NAD-dependent epimerase/dehydratase family protein [Bradyrhizobium sp. AUGA SZCCT0274]|uniref:NAD-dependent epimerase/dehydratase family protein n=1 Tax=Bradyrhizobium sp. AUGA SZCCT0274 TaxID=2807670 RepID=UPI001BA4754D|nr:NAD-dependent epimerase/dehydratase family protein [Bradyrhizobium sp. AUGA SZCCT0274]MBR1244183.1 NAD-dependent epimerase/dehydratase family protein [Bradyrhizobium sp. AUGA SZCCT0274]
MKVFVTGGAGQVGSTVIDMLLARGNQVVGIDNFSTGRRDNLAPHANLRLVEDTITDAAVVDRLFAEFKPEVVIHTAASYKDPDDWGTDALVNAAGTANIAKASKTHGASRLIYFQTALCYGTKPLQSPITLDHPIDPVNSSYAISKTAGEHYVQFSGVDWVTFRLANVIGERNVSGPLPIFFERLSAGKKCFVTPARRDFCYAKDLARVVVRAADGTGHGTYHFSSGKDVAIRELYDAVVGAMKLNDYPEPEVKPLGKDDAASILLDPSRTFTDFGAVEFTPLAKIAEAAVERWKREGVQGGYTHLKVARS